MFPSLSRAKRSFCEAQIWMNCVGASLTVPSRCESLSRWLVVFINASFNGGVPSGSRRILPSCWRAGRSAFASVVRVRITLEAAERVIPARLSVDRDEHQGSRPQRLIHPDGARHGSRGGVDSLPHAIHRRGSEGRTGGGSEEPPRGTHHLPTPIETGKLTVSSR